MYSCVSIPAVPGAPEATAQIGHGADEALDLALAVADGHIGQNIANVAEFDLDAVFVAQQIIDLDPGQAEPERVDGQLRDVEVEKARSVDALLGERIVIADGVDLRAAYSASAATRAMVSCPRRPGFRREMSRLASSRYDALVVCVRLITART